MSTEEGTNETQLRVLVLEDDPWDAELVERELASARFSCEMERVEDEETFRLALREFQPDLILADYNLPTCTAIDALEAMKEERPGTPFIIVSGTLGDEIAVETLKAGATDYVLKDRLARLGPSVRRALGEVEERRELERGYELLRRSGEERSRLLALLIEAEGSERSAIASAINDDSITVMTEVATRLGVLGSEVEGTELEGEVERLSATLQGAIERLRDRLIELRPSTLDEDGLGAAIREHQERLAESGGPELDVRDELVDEPSRHARAIVYRAVQEALANAREHATARHVEVLVASRDGGVLARISDDGVGFDPDRVPAPSPGRLGLASMRERVEGAGGTVRIVSASGVGTSVELWIPDGVATGDPPAGD